MGLTKPLLDQCFSAWTLSLELIKLKMRTDTKRIVFFENRVDVFTYYKAEVAPVVSSRSYILKFGRISVTHFVYLFW